MKNKLNVGVIGLGVGAKHAQILYSNKKVLLDFYSANHVAVIIEITYCSQLNCYTIIRLVQYIYI
jgi:hypothetical protein